MHPERPLNSSQEIEQALADLPRLTRNELDKVRPSVRLFSTNQRHRFFVELMLYLADETMMLGKAMERNREAIERFDNASGRLSTRIYWLTWGVFILTGVLVMLAILKH